MGYLKWSRVERVKLRPKGWVGGSHGKNGGGAFRQREDPLSTERRLVCGGLGGEIREVGMDLVIRLGVHSRGLNCFLGVAVGGTVSFEQGRK